MDSLIYFITYFVVGWFVVSFFVMLYFALRYRSRGGSIAKYIKGEGWKQTKWVLIPVLLVVISDALIDIKTASVWATMNEAIVALDKDGKEITDESGNPTPDTLKYQNKIEKWKFPDGKTLDKKDVELVKVTAKQFGFDFEYAGVDGQFGTPDDKKTMDFAHLPVDKRIIFYLTSVDVIHAFWIKNIRLKYDMIPGRFVKKWVEIEKKLVEKDSKVNWNDKIMVDEIKAGYMLGMAGDPKDRADSINNRKKIIDSNRVFELACAEICGDSHTKMMAWIVVESQDMYNAWLKEK